MISYWALLRLLPNGCLMAFSRHRLGQIRCSDPHVQAVHCGLVLSFSSFLQEKSH
jgi:hypothetical protein